MCRLGGGDSKNRKNESTSIMDGPLDKMTTTSLYVSSFLTFLAQRQNIKLVIIDSSPQVLALRLRLKNANSLQGCAKF